MYRACLENVLIKKRAVRVEFIQDFAWAVAKAEITA